MNHGFWRGRRVFVTGHTGFMGGWLTLWLAERGAQMAGYALAPPTRPSLFEAADIARSLCSVSGDVRDYGRLAATIQDFAPEIVIHLAAQSLVRAGQTAPLETFSTNVIGTANLLQALRGLRSLAAAVIVTTDKVYENHEIRRGFHEQDRLGGLEPYGGSKACAEIVVDSFRHAYFSAAARRPGVATVRAGNIIGGGDWAADRLIPDAVRAFEAGKLLLLRHPDAVRPWQHVLDPVAGILALAERLAGDPARWEGAWNLGPHESDARTVAAVADELVRRWGDGAAWSRDPTGPIQPYEARLLALDCTKAADVLGWHTRWSLDRAIAATVEWYKAYRAKDDVRGLALRQISAFEGVN